MKTEQMNTVLMVVLIVLMFMQIIPGKVVFQVNRVTGNDLKGTELAGREVLTYTTYKQLFGCIPISLPNSGILEFHA